MCFLSCKISRQLTAYCRNGSSMLLQPNAICMSNSAEHICLRLLSCMWQKDHFSCLRAISCKPLHSALCSVTLRFALPAILGQILLLTLANSSEVYPSDLMGVYPALIGQEAWKRPLSKEVFVITTLMHLRDFMQTVSLSDFKVPLKVGLLLVFW